jgi:hypothetical protein
MIAAVVTGRRGCNKKTHDRCQPWVLSKSGLFSTSAYGLAGYNDEQQYNLPNN